MTTYRFKTRVSNKGIIKVPASSHLLDKDVEVVLVNIESSKSKEISASNFVEKWAGFLAPSNSEDSRYDYLTEKYK